QDPGIRFDGHAAFRLVVARDFPTFRRGQGLEDGYVIDAISQELDRPVAEQEVGPARMSAGELPRVLEVRRRTRGGWVNHPAVRGVDPAVGDAVVDATGGTAAGGRAHAAALLHQTGGVLKDAAVNRGVRPGAPVRPVRGRGPMFLDALADGDCVAGPVRDITDA